MVIGEDRNITGKENLYFIIIFIHSYQRRKKHHIVIKAAGKNI